MTGNNSAFIGDIPENYEKYLGPLIFREYAEDLANRVSIPADGVLLEIAAGTGMATRQLRDAIDRDVRIVVTDLNEDMLNVARTKFNNDENMEFQTADALNLPFEDSSFDVIVCQFSVMFFPDKLLALRQAARVLKPGGLFYFNIWDSFEHNHLVRTVNKTVTECLPDNPPTFYQVPYGYHDINVIKDILFQAGFGAIDLSVLPRTSSATEARHVALGYVMGNPTCLHIQQTAPESLADIVNAVEQAIGDEFGFSAISAKMQAIVFRAEYSG